MFRLGEFLIGFTTSFRMGQVLRHHFTPPPLPRRARDIERYMVVEFVDELRATMKRAGYAETQNGRESAGEFLIGIRGRLFTISDDYQVAENRVPYAAVGVGREVASGALCVTSGYAGRAAVLTALLAAQEHSAGVRGPFTVESIP